MAVDKRTARLGVLATVSLLLIGLLGARLWFLQGVESEEYQAKVTAAKTREVYIAPERGRIFDADGRIVADNRRILTVTVEWSVIRKESNRLKLFERLSGPLQTPVDDLMRRYNPCYPGKAGTCDKGQLYDTLLPLPLKEDVSEEIVNFLMERQEDYPGVDVVAAYKRVYPYAPLASHVVGFMGAISAENLDSYLAQGYKRNERVGQFGVELSLERELHGRWGKRVYEVDASGSIVRELLEERVEPVAGFDVQLSVDLDIQQYAEQALETELRNRRNLPQDELASDRAPYNGLDPKTNFETRIYRQKLPDGTLIDYPQWVQHKAPAGAVVVLDHTNGQVIAMASYPTFDNRWMDSGITGTKYKELFPAFKEDGVTPIDPDESILVNRAVQGNYNLGSTIKPFISWAALHAGIITANTTFFDEGTYQLQTIPPENCQNNGGLVRCIFKNATNRLGQPSSYGEVTVEDALAVSSDAFFYKIGEEMWLASERIPGQENEENPENLLKTNLERFGFGNKSGIQLPFEWKGRIPDDQVKRDLVERGVLLEGEQPRLLVGDNVQVSIGQGLMAATPLQSANAYATLANGGLLLQPSIVKAIYAPLTPDAGPAMADLAAGTIVKSFALPVVKDQLEMPPEVFNPIVAGLTRVIEGKGTTYPSNFYHATTGESLFKNYPVRIAGKTGTVQGAGNLPWNDSSAFGAFGLEPDMPYTVFAYLEKAGYGSKAAAPVTKCIFLALAGEVPTDPVLISDPLDLTSTVAAPSKQLADASCLGGSAGIKD